MAILHDSAYDVCCEAMALLREEQTLNRNCVLTETDTTVTPNKTANKVEAACNRTFETARHDILDTFSWSFCKRDIDVSSSQGSNGRFVTPYPGQAEVKILTCLDAYGSRVEYTLRGREQILSREPIANIVYLEDEPDVTQWPRTVRTALVYRLAAMLAVEITGRTSDAELYEKRSMHYVQKARTDDARQSGTGTSVYGNNYLYDIATGRRRPKHMRFGSAYGKRW